MILRLWRARLRPGVEPALLERLRDLVADARPGEGPVDFTFGVRHEAGSTGFLALSVWPDFESLLAATGGDVTRTVRQIQLDDLCETTEAETLERLAPPPAPAVDLADGRVLGVVLGSVKPNFEAAAQEMIDRSAKAALDAGALAAHAGRRLVGPVTRIAVIVVWPDRDTLGRFVRARDVGAIDPRFIELMQDWRFETYTGLAPARLLVPPAGPAILITDDDGRYLEATPGVERVLGIPPELLVGRSVMDLVAQTGADGDLWNRFREERAQEGVIELRRPDGRVVQARYRAATDCPGPGTHASVLVLPGETPDPRPVAEIVAEALPRVATGAG